MATAKKAAEVAWANRIVGSRQANPAELTPHPLNFRGHPDKQRHLMRGALKEIGWIQQPVINVRTGHILDGHLRVEEALREGIEEIPILEVDLSEEEERKVLASLDRITGYAETDADSLEELLRGIKTEDKALGSMFKDMADEAGINVDEEDLEDDLPIPSSTKDGVLQYNIVFDNTDQQGRWYEFVKELRSKYSDYSTMGERLDAYLEEVEFGQGD